MSQVKDKLKEVIRSLPSGPGVYLMKDRLGSILYVGKAKNLKKRVSSYFQPSRKTREDRPKIVAMMELVFDVEIIEVKSEPEALLLEGRLIKEWKPRYNTDFTDDKRFLLVRLDVYQPLPKFRLVRFKTDDKSEYYGPFAHSSMLRKTLAEMRKKFGILLADSKPKKLENGSWKLYDDARAEIYGHENVLTEEAYRERVEQAIEFLKGKGKEWLDEIKEEMLKAADKQEFEKAAKLRDVILALQKTTEKTRKFEKPIMPKRDDAKILKELQSMLQLKRAPERMECFDISHISGSFCVASMVSFFKGKPDKKNYRRFKIKSFIGNDDFRAMEEVVERRYMRLHKEEKAFPDLVIIDGGIGQVGSALKAFLLNDLEPPMIIGLAKKEEKIIFCDGREPLLLPAKNEARKLLQRIRDEAHRFANSFNAELRSKKIRATILDDFEGLGKVKRAAVLNYFGDFAALKKAKKSELLKVDGIGPKLAESLYDFLQQ